MSNFDQRGQAVVNQQNADVIVNAVYGIQFLELAKRLGVIESALRVFFRLLEEKECSIDDLDNELRNIAEKYLRLKDSAKHIYSEDSEISDLYKRARDALDIVDLESAEALISIAVKLDMEAVDAADSLAKRRRYSAAKGCLLKAEALHLRGALVDAAEACRASISIGEHADARDILCEANVKLGEILYESELFDESDSCFQESFRISIKDKNIQAIIHSLRGMGLNCLARANNVAAAKFFQDAINGCSLDLVNFNETATALKINLAAAYKGSGRFDDALEMLNRINISSASTDATSISIRRVVENDIGLIFHAIGDIDGALEKYKAALELARKAYANGHVEVLRIRTNVAGALLDKGLLDEAISIFEDVIGCAEPITVGRRLVAVSANNGMGLAKLTKGRTTEAERYFLKALELARDVLGENPEVARIYRNIGALRIREGRFDAALEAANNALAIDQSVNGTAHPSIAGDYRLMAEAKQYLHDFSAAIECIERAIDINVRVFGEFSAPVSVCLNNLLAIQIKARMYEAAKACFERLKFVNEKLYGPDDLSMAFPLNNIGMLFHDLGRYDDAIKVFEQSLKIHQRVYGANSAGAATVLNNIGLVWCAKRDFDRAIYYFEQSIKVADGVEIAPQELGVTLNNIASCYAEKGQYSEAICVFMKSIDALSRCFDPSHPMINSVNRKIALIKSRM